MIENSFFEVLFDKEDYFCTGSVFENKVVSVFGRSLAEELAEAFFTANPINSQVNFNKKYDPLVPRRSDINVTKFRNFLFEMDSINLEDQMKLLKECEISWGTITFSGSKSLHAILSLQDPLNLDPHEKNSVQEYKDTWKKIAAYLNSKAFELGICKKNQLVIDASCKNPSRFTRYPNFLRPETGMVQKVEYIGSRMSDLEFKELMSKCPDIVRSGPVKTFSKDKPVTTTEKQFMLRAPLGLIGKLKYVTFGGERNMYEHVWQLMVWAIDETNPTYDLLIELTEKYIIPKLLYKYNYYDKSCESIYAAVLHAYDYKGEGQ